MDIITPNDKKTATNLTYQNGSRCAYDHRVSLLIKLSVSGRRKFIQRLEFRVDDTAKGRSTRRSFNQDMLAERIRKIHRRQISKQSKQKRKEKRQKKSEDNKTMFLPADCLKNIDLSSGGSEDSMEL